MKKDEIEKIVEVCKDRLCKVVYRDGPRIHATKGQIIGIADSFLQVQSFHNDYFIAISEILKIQASRNEGDEGR
jgi:hypothetical protein